MRRIPALFIANLLALHLIAPASAQVGGGGQPPAFGCSNSDCFLSPGAGAPTIFAWGVD